MNEIYEGCGKGDHCWDRLGSVGYNTTDGTTVERDTEKCRHCTAQRVREVTSKVTSTVVKDTGWRNPDQT